MLMKTKTSKGFFFVLISFMLVSYIFLYLTAWINAMAITEKNSAEKFRAASLEGLVTQLTQDKFMQFFDISGNHALFRMNGFASNLSHPMKYDPGDELYYMRRAFFSTVFDGTSGDFENEALVYSDSERETYSFSAWLDNLNTTLSRAGLSVKEFSISGENLTQLTPVTFEASMNISMLVEDNVNLVSVRRTFYLDRNFSVEGLPDPMISREYTRINSADGVEKQIYFHDVPQLDSFGPINRANGTTGLGFFYGPMIAATDVTDEFPLQGLRGQYILVGNYSDITDISFYAQFGAFILTNDPVTEATADCPGSPQSESETFWAVKYLNSSGSCERTITDKFGPFAVIPDFNMSAFSGPGSEHHALIIANHSVQEVSADEGTNFELKYEGASAYDMEKLRDATVCAYYLPSEAGPSYAQRLSAGALTLNSTFGMETFLVGKWAGGMDASSYDIYSRLDREFFLKVEGPKIRGLAGCKSAGMCATSVGENAPLGHFRLSAQALEEYGVSVARGSYIACDDNRAGCD